jgi:hypothetical protein
MTSPPINPDGWRQPNLDDDPIYGSPESIEAIAQRFAAKAVEFGEAAQQLRTGVPGESWRSRAGLRCTEVLQVSAGHLSELHRGHEECAQALTGWAEQLRSLRRNVELAQEDARDAQQRLDTAEAKLQELDDTTGWSDPVEPKFPFGDPVPMTSTSASTQPAVTPGGVTPPVDISPPVDRVNLREHWERQAEEARADLEAARRRIDEAVATRDDAAADTARRIESALPRPVFRPA